MQRVTTLFSGPQVVGGGISRMYFNDGGTAADAVTAVATFWGAARDAVSALTTISVQSEVDLMTTAGLITGTADGGDTVNLVGTDDSDPLPPSMQSLVRWRTGEFINGREVRGRLFVPSAGESYSTAGKPSGARLTTLTAAAAALVASGAPEFVVWSKTHGVMHTVETSSVAPYFAVLRSRRD